MTGSFTVPNQEQEKLLRELGLDPKAYAVKLESEEMLWLLHYKSRHEIVIRMNRRACV